MWSIFPDDHNHRFTKKVGDIISNLVVTRSSDTYTTQVLYNQEFFDKLQANFN